MRITEPWFRVMHALQETKWRREKGDTVKVRIPHLVLAVAGAALIAAACGDSDTKDDTPTALPATTQAPTTAPATAAASAATPEMMPMQPGSENMKLAITSPTDGAIITANEVTLDVTATEATPTRRRVC